MDSQNRIIRSGFGHYSYVIGPWADFAIGNASKMTDPTASAGVMLGTRIEGGSKGAVISCLDFEAPINIVGSAVSLVWRLAVIKGEAPTWLIKKATAPQGGLQGAVLAVPADGDGSQDQNIIFGRNLVSQATGAGQGTAANGLHLPFPDFKGPAVGPGEVMTVIVYPLINNDGTPGYGAVNKTLLTLGVWGAYGSPEELSAGRSDGEPDSARALPRQAARGVR